MEVIGRVESGTETESEAGSQSRGVITERRPRTLIQLGLYPTI